MASKSSGKHGKKKLSPAEKNLQAGMGLLHNHSLFGGLKGELLPRNQQALGKTTPALVNSDGYIYLNQDILLAPKQWLFLIAHCLLHLAFGHFDTENMPAYEIEDSDGKPIRKVSFQPFLWNEACDIYIDRFLIDIKVGEPLFDIHNPLLTGSQKDELQIYSYLIENHFSDSEQLFGTGAPNQCYMIGLKNQLTYHTENGDHNRFAAQFAYHMANCVTDAVSQAGGHTLSNPANTPAQKAAKWFIDHYPLLGGLASHFSIIEDYRVCYQYDIQIAAIDTDVQEIYINPANKYSQEHWKFILAHEYLHAGLLHRERCQGRDPYLWNIACDFVINCWLNEMQIGEMPQDGSLYDETLRGMSAESIYDQMLSDMRKYRKLNTYHGNGGGDILGNGTNQLPTQNRRQITTLDDFCKEALQQGLEYHKQHERGYLPAGLMEEIRALSMPVIPWDVQLANWFDLHFEPLEKHRTYARPSRRQASTPDIPRPHYESAAISEYSRTFGVIIDTSGSMSAKLLGMALGSIASYATAKEVPMARVVFCDAQPYDAGYLSVEDIAGRVRVQGRGGTVLQPAVTLLHNAKDFPKDGPILIITDGMIENRLSIHHEHAYLLPRGCRLPFHTKSPVFYFSGAGS